MVEFFNTKEWEMKVSLIMPTYNRDFIIELAIQSIVHQKEHSIDIELLIGDDGDDNTDKIVAEIKNVNPKLQILYRKTERIPLSDKINKLIRESSGEFYGLIGSDDFQSPYKIIAFEKALAQNPDGDMFGQRKFIFHDIVFNKSLLWIQNRRMDKYMAGSFLLIRRTIFNEYDGYGSGLWKSIDTSLANKVDWSKIKLIDVENIDDRVLLSSIAMQHKNNIWIRKKRGFNPFRKKQTSNFLTKKIRIDMETMLEECYPIYQEIAKPMRYEYSWFNFRKRFNLFWKK